MCLLTSERWDDYTFLDGSGFLITLSSNAVTEISRAEYRKMPQIVFFVEVE